VKSCLMEIHAGHAARWGQANDGQASYSQNVENYALLALSSSPAVGSLTFDVDAELLLGGADLPMDDATPGDGEQSVTADRGAEVAYFLATLRLPDGAPQAALQNSPVVSATSHPSRSVFAAAHEDGSLHLWRFGQRQSFQQLPRPSAPAKTSANRSGAAEDTGEVSSGSSGRWSLDWSPCGNRLLGVLDAPGRNMVNLWTVAEGSRPGPAYSLPTGAAHSRLLCAAFASATGSVVATAGRRAETEFVAPGLPSTAGMLKAWPHVAAGICVWDTIAPSASSLVAHDGADASSASMPAEYSALAWAASQQRIFCGTKAGELRVFDLRMRRISHRFEALGDPVQHCFVLQTTGQLASLSSAELKLWSLKNLELLDTIPLHGSGRGVSASVLGAKVLSCATLLSERHLVTAGQDGTVVLTRL
ncbi:Dmxl2, partial [Symbiodinium microadriaticum]